ncbi:hypothetical protein BJX64DRAFT_154487 [Aspergillus heterothallicus]
MRAFTTTSLRSLLSAVPRTAPTARAFSSSASRAASRALITGRLGATPELRTSKNGTEYLAYSIASREIPRNGEPIAQWWRVVAYLPQNSRDFMMSLSKGSLLFIEGDLQQSKFTDDNGVERHKVIINQRNFEVLSSKREADAHSGETP